MSAAEGYSMYYTDWVVTYKLTGKHTSSLIVGYGDSDYDKIKAMVESEYQNREKLKAEAIKACR